MKTYQEFLGEAKKESDKSSKELDSIWSEYTNMLAVYDYRLNRDELTKTEIKTFENKLKKLKSRVATISGEECATDMDTFATYLYERREYSRGKTAKQLMSLLDKWNIQAKDLRDAVNDL